jgi:xanthosine utilization system XapX-like protein
MNDRKFATIAAVVVFVYCMRGEPYPAFPEVAFSLCGAIVGVELGNWLYDWAEGKLRGDQ